ncbi:MAG: hypothetical protein AB1705_14605 [Verrucomicrobiota bacterium]
MNPSNPLGDKTGVRWLCLLALSAAVVICFTGCVKAGGKAKSLHLVEQFNPQTGKLQYRETKRDYSRIGNAGLLASQEASGLTHTRSNALTGASSSTGVASVKGRAEPEAITAAGKAGGELLGTAMKKATTGQ